MITKADAATAAVLFAIVVPILFIITWQSDKCEQFSGQQERGREKVMFDLNGVIPEMIDNDYKKEFKTIMSDNIVITERLPDGMPQWVDDAMAAGTLFLEIKARYLAEDTLLAEQRQICADAIPESSMYKDHCYLPVARKACINATGESNDN